MRNQVLSALPSTDLVRLKPHFETLRLNSATVRLSNGDGDRHVIFPENALVSLVSQLRGGNALQVATIGREGMVGLDVFLGDCDGPTRAVTLAPGVVRRIDARAFKRLSGTPGPFHDVMLRYTQAFLSELGQTAACNGSHLVEERCARWLLVTRERVDETTFLLSHELLALMLGVRPAGVMVALVELQRKGLVRYAHGTIDIIDSLGLERASCECYNMVRGQYARLLAPNAQ